MKKYKVTILTDPILSGRYILLEGLKKIVRILRNIIYPSKNYSNHTYYRGHFSVTRSLIEGLKSIEADFNYNPLFASTMADTVIVLAGVETLSQAIRLKREGKIKKLFAGPNIVIFSSDFNSILASPEIDAVITPSDWVTDLYLEDNIRLRGRIFSWAAGVNTNYWMPDLKVNSDKILVYDKQIDDAKGTLVACIEYLVAKGWTVQIVKYGFYTQGQYLNLLRNSCLLVGFANKSESQGIAWAEAWSVNIPTLLLRKTSSVINGRLCKSSTAPYLCEENGLFFDDFDDFKRKFDYWDINRIKFNPRAWVLNKMSDEKSSAYLYNKVIN